MSENVAYGMTFSTLNASTNKVLSRSNSRPSGKPSSPNLRSNPLTTPEVIKYLHRENDDANFPSSRLKDNNEPPDTDEYVSPGNSNSPSKKKMPIIGPNKLVGKNFLLPQEDS